MNQVESLVGQEVSLEWTPEEKNNVPPRYGCQILLQNTTLEIAKDSSFPSDAYLIWYEVDGETRMDLCRTSKRINLFDLYYDKFGPGSIKKIDFGYGRTNPKLWGYKQPEKKKKK